MAFKKLSIHRDARGFAHLALILVALAVVGIGGFAYWRISSYTNNDDTNGRSVSNSESGATNTAAVSAECVAQTGDENICRFGAIADLSQFSSEVKMTMHSNDQEVTYTIKYDGKGNHFVDIGGGNMGMSVGGRYYVYMMDAWYDSGSDSSQVPKSSVPSFGFATTAGITYENQGKEPCGSDTCLKYRMSGGILADGVVTALIGDKDYLPRRIDSTGGLLGSLTMTVEYKDVTITAPEGAKPISSLYEGFGTE